MKQKEHVLLFFYCSKKHDFINKLVNNQILKKNLENMKKLLFIFVKAAYNWYRQLYQKKIGSLFASAMLLHKGIKGVTH